jgi:hypothetical protein
MGSTTQIGNRFALFGPELERALVVAPWFKQWRAGRDEQQPGFPPGRSWPLSHIKGLGRSLRAKSVPYAYIAEEGYLPGGLKRRALRYLFQLASLTLTHPIPVVDSLSGDPAHASS